MNESIIQIANLSHRVGNNYLLKNINWQINRGERWVVFGSNGSGKTTLLSILAGFNNYENGSYKIFGQEMQNASLDDIRKKIGWVSSSFFDKIYSVESVLEIVLSGKSGSLGLRDNITNADLLKANNLLQKMGLGNKLNQQYCTLSKGEQQNTLLARALLTNPEILILDEPCTGLDLINREKVFSELRRFAENKNLTIIYVTHYLEEIIDIFNNALFLRHGEVFAKGSVNELFTSQMLSGFFDENIEVLKEKGKIIPIFRGR